MQILCNEESIEEMARDVEEILSSELQHCLFAIQLDEPTFGSSNIIMAYVSFHSSSLNNSVDKFLFGNYFETDSKGETFFHVWRII